MVWIEIETDKPEVLDLSVTTLRVVWIEIRTRITVAHTDSSHHLAGGVD